LDSEEVFRNCSSRDTKTLVAELQTAFKDLDKQCSLSSNPSDSTLDSMGTEESIKEQSGESSLTGMGKRKQSSMPTGTVKKSRVVDDMQDACENCLISNVSGLLKQLGNVLFSRFGHKGEYVKNI